MSTVHPFDPEAAKARANESGLPPGENGADLLTETRSFIGRFCVFPDEHALVAVTLWAAHAHMATYFYTSPRLTVVSPEANCGKTRVLEVLDLLVPDPMLCLSASPAAIFRTLAVTPITLLIDEVDTIFRQRGKDDSNEDLRALLNAGYKRGATIPRCVGPRHDVQNFAVFCPTALAGIGDMPDTIMSRSIIIRIRRRSPSETIHPFRLREQESAGHQLRDGLASWARDVGRATGDAWPAMPEGVVDRPAEVWEPLIAVADAAGGEWPARARTACLALVKVAAERRASLGIRLLADLRIIFGEAIALHTETILERLHKGEAHGLEADAPWAELQGKPLGDRGLATMLKKYDVAPLKVKVGGVALKGYRREHLWDAWQRYLPPSSHSPKEEEPEEPREPGEDEVPQVPQVPLAMGSVSTNGAGGVRCRDCKFYDRSGAAYCIKLDRGVHPDRLHHCPEFAP